MVTKKRPEEGQSPSPAKRTTTTKSRKTEGEPKRAPRAAGASASKSAARPKLRASHSDGARASTSKTSRSAAGSRAKGPALSRGPAVRKAPLAAPKREKVRKAVPETPSAARQLALDIVAGGLEKKALNCEIIDVRGRVDYADFLVIMTGRSDRHVASIAQGIQEELGKKKISPISVEGMTVATWVLIDYGDVVAHVFQEDARQLYDIEGLWMDAGRLNVPGEPGQTAPVESVDAADDDEEEEDLDESDGD